MSVIRAGAALAVALALILAPAGNGAQRGGNHGCDVNTGVFFSDHFFASGDRVIAGFYTEEVGGLPPHEDDVLLSENIGPKGPSSLDCSTESGGWTLFKSRLGPGKDKVRLDAVGLQRKYSEQPGPLPKSIDGLLAGGGGRDRLRGHVGFDKFRGGAGGDVIKAADGKRDTIRCGPGKDKAVVDAQDQIAKCERVVER